MSNDIELNEHDKLAVEILEKVVINQDLSGLTAIEKVKYIKSICNSIGLNPLTKPIQLLKFQGKEVIYITKDATEQLRKIHTISLFIRETKLIEDIYIVITEATTPDGRTDSASAAISLLGLKGIDKANAMMKCETKSKRRVTLSICGLGFADEHDPDIQPPSTKVHNLANKTNQITRELSGNIVNKTSSLVNNEEIEKIRDEYIEKIKKADSLDSLKNIFEYVIKTQHIKDPVFKETITILKDDRKEYLMSLNDDFKKQWDTATGEIPNDRSDV